MYDSNVNQGPCDYSATFRCSERQQNVAGFFSSHTMNECMYQSKKKKEKAKNLEAVTHRALSPFTHAVDSSLIGAARLQTLTHMLLCWP